MPSYDVRLIPSTNVPSNPRREHCSAHHSRIATIGRHPGQQVRLERYAPDGVQLVDRALYTVIDVHEEEPDVVFVGYRDPEPTHHDLRDRLELPNTDPFTGKINSQVPDPSLTDEEAEKHSEFVERVTDNGRHRGLIVIAPHGGTIERHTDEQAERVGQKLASKCISVWLCKGFRKGGGAFDRWHITSTDINEESFPKLKTVIGRHFEYAVAFHGWNEDSVCIGGSAPHDLKKKIKTTIITEVPGLESKVKTDSEGCPEAFNGNDPKNIVNRLATKGVQIEQSEDARKTYGVQIADSVAAVIGPRIKVCTAPVFEGSSPGGCLLRGVGYSLLVMPLIPLAWVPPITCEIKRLMFRIRNCRRGNTDPCIEL
jgi:phage replication-related protein YjqB (UPF0714/DUF867 family)